jgi:hypothetical protein
MLRLPLYPGAIPDESTLGRWVHAPNPKSGKGESVALLRLQAVVPIEQVAVWYRTQLSVDFVRREGNLAAAVEGSERWLAKVSTNPNADAILFVRSEAGVREGVLLEAGHRSDQALIAIFRYGGPQP